MRLTNLLTAITLFCVQYNACAIKCDDENGNDTIMERLLPNNCSVVRVNCTEEADGYGYHYLKSSSIMPAEYQYPLMICMSKKGDGKTFNSTVAPNDLREIIFKYDEHVELNLLDLARFTNLTTLRLQGEQMTINLNQTANSTNILTLQSLIISDYKLDKFPYQILEPLRNLTKVVLSKNQLNEIKGDVFIKNPNLKTIIFTHNELTQLNMSWLNDTKKLKHLTMRSVGLETIPQELISTKSEITYLDLSDNRISTLQRKSFINMRKLSVLILANNSIESIPTLFFKTAYSLRYVDLSANKIIWLKTDILSFFVQLTDLTLNFQNNPIHCNKDLAWMLQWLNKSQSIGQYPDIRLKCFNPAMLHNRDINSLTMGDLSRTMGEQVIPFEGCNISAYEEAFKRKYLRPTSLPTTPKPIATVTVPQTTLPRTTHERLRCISVCDCYYNKEEYFEATGVRNPRFPFPAALCNDKMFKDFPSGLSPSTATVSLKYNQINKLDVGGLKYLQNLQYLDLTGNVITVIVPDNGTILQSLEFLKLSGNRIKVVDSTKLQSFPALKHFFIGGNDITRIPADTLVHNRNLDRLYLGPNHLSGVIPEKLIDGLHLIKLELNGVGLKEIPEFIKNMPNLIRLDMTDNAITSVKADAFKNCSSLLKLHLANNEITKLEANVFKDLHNLEELDLSENNLTLLSESVFNTISRDVDSIKLWKNPIACDCKARWIYDAIVLRKIENPSLDIRFECASPENFRGMTSDDLKHEDFVCSSETEIVKKSEMKKENEHFAAVYTGKDLALSILLTFVIAFAIGFLSKVFHGRKFGRNQGSYSNLITHHESSRASYEAEEVL